MQDITQMTFYITYVMLLTTGTITFIEAIATNSPAVRHIMNLETCISIIASFFYWRFVDQISKDGINHQSITLTRYTDWFLTTPLMLMVLLLVLGHERIPLHLPFFLLVIFLNFAMLLAGFLGEKEVISKPTATATGFIPFFIMFALIWYVYIRTNRRTTDIFIFYTFVAIWALYGVVYLADDKTKTISHNLLDLTSKCLMGIFFWMYLTRVIVW